MRPAPGLPPLTPRQRWLAAQRLAAGDGLEEAASFADAEPEALAAVLGDPRFEAQLAAERAKVPLSDEAWAARMKLMVRQAAEVALADGKVSTVNTLLRTSLLLPVLAAAPEARAAALQAVARIAAADAHPADAEPPAPRAESDAEAARRAALLAALKPALRPSFAAAPPEALEQCLAAADPDPATYEAWRAARAAQASAAEPVPLEPEDVAAIRRATRHNPPWLRGEHLGCFRPPAPEGAFTAEEPAASAAPPPAPPAPESPVAGLRARVARLLDRAAARLPEELDLAEAICALKWPKWPEYHGPVDLFDLREALRSVPIDTEALHWLASRELAELCRRAAAAPGMAQGP